MSERERRIGLNEAVFREVNEQIEGLSRSSAGAANELDLICECPDRGCTERISMPRGDYEELRADPLQFAITPGHAEASVETVVARRTSYELVRKQAADAAEAALETDPRS